MTASDTRSFMLECGVGARFLSESLTRVVDALPSAQLVLAREALSRIAV